VPAEADERRNRLEQARAAAQRLVDVLETTDTPIDQILMMGERLARLLRDGDAQRWLDLEMRGYPEDTEVQLGSCGKYVYRFTDNKVTYAYSLPQLEAHARATGEYFKKLSGPTVDKPVENYVVAAATQQVMKDALAQMGHARQAWEIAVANFARMKNAIHQWATDTLISLELGGVAESVFEAARVEADRFIATNAPQAAEQLLAANERLIDATKECLSAALTSCRRLLVTVADSVFPARDVLVNGRKVGAENYKNRLLAYIEERLASGSTNSLLEADLSHLAARLDALNDKANKGVHENVTVAETHLVLVETYLFLAELGRLSRPSPKS